MTKLRAAALPRRLLAPLILALAFLSAGRGCLAGTPPTVLTFLKPVTAAGISLQMDHITYKSGDVGTPMTGSGSLHLIVLGSPAIDLNGVPFAGVLADGSGVVQPTKTGYTFNQDLPWSDVLGTGTDITFQKPVILVDVAGKQLTITGAAKADLPFRSGDGSRASAAMEGLKLSLDAAGPCSLDADLQLNALKDDGLPLAGFTVRMTSPHIKLQRPASPLFNLSARTVSVDTPIPNLFSGKNITLTGTDFTADENGLPSFGNIHLASGPPSPVRLASLRMVSLGGAPPPVYELGRPLNFGLEVTDFACSGVTQGRFRDMTIKGNLLLPSALTDGHGGRAKIEGVTVQPLVPSISVDGGPRPFTAQWDPLANKLLFTLTVTRFDVDMHGIHNITATLELPSKANQIQSQDHRSFTLGVKDFSVDSTGIFGAAEIKDANLEVLGFPVNHVHGALSFNHGSLTAGTFGASVHVADVGDLDTVVGMSRTGLSVDVTPSAGLHWSLFGADLNLAAGSVHVQDTGQSQLLLTGTLKFPKLPDIQDVELAFKDLEVGTNGTFGPQELSLVHPCDMDLKVLSVHVSKLTYNAESKHILLDGSVKLPDSLPLQAEVGFQGLDIQPSPLKLTINGMHIEAGVLGVGHVAADIVDNGDWPEQNLHHVLAGDAKLSIDALGSGIGAKFLIADQGAWLVAANIDIPGGIPFPPPIPLQIVGFGGGLGHNVVLSSTANPGDLRSYQFSDGSWLAQARCSISTPDHTLLWGDLILTVGLPEFSLNLHGDMALATRRDSNPHPDFASLDRHATADITWDGPHRTFRAGGNLDYYFPSRSLNLCEAHGGLDLLVSPVEGHLFVGWPINERPVQLRLLGGVFNVKGGIGLTLYDPAHETWLKGAFDESLDLGIIKGDVGASFAVIYDWPTHDLDVQVEGHASGEVDFIVVHAGASADLYGEVVGSPFPPKYVAVKGEFSAEIGVGPFSASFDTGEKTLFEVGSK